MLQFLNISNIALIDDMQVEFESGLNLLTGETGSGKSIIVDALGVLIGGRFTSELIKTGAERAAISVPTTVAPPPRLSMMIGCPSSSVMRCATVRAMVSVAPPGA